MKSIKELWQKHKGEVIYIVGTSPSMRVFPIDFLKGKTVIGLNQAFHYASFTYGLTIHPYLIPVKSHKWNCQWITKHKTIDQKYKEHIQRNNYSKMYVFKNSLDWGVIDGKASSTLYVGRGIQTAAMHLAAHLGASAAILVGVGMASLAGDHHGHDQHTELHGMAPAEVYKEYYFYAVKTRELIRKVFGMQVLSLVPFLGDIYAEIDYRKLKEELNIPNLPPVKDIEYAKRTENLVCDFI